MKFIEFDECVVNTKYIGKIIPVEGINSKHGEFGITLVLDGFENITEWFETAEKRDDRFSNIKDILLW